MRKRGGMKRLLDCSGFLGIIVCLVLACSSPTPEELASLAAKGYYDHLIHGEYEQFLEGVAPSEASQLLIAGEEDAYHAQMLDSYRQFMADQQKSHNGIREVRVVRAKADTLQRYTNVFLTLCYGDSTNEEIVVPMVEKDGRWRMK